MKRSGPNQCDRVRRLLDKHGANGITQADFDTPCVDGFNHIPQIARRIKDLRDEGYAITTLKRDGYCTYVWSKYLSPVTAEVVRGVDVSSNSAAASLTTSEPEASLFELPAVAPANAIYEDAA